MTITTDTINTLLNPFFNTCLGWSEAWREQETRFDVEEGVLCYDWRCAMWLNPSDEDEDKWISHHQLRHLLNTFGISYQLVYDNFEDEYVLLSDLRILSPHI